MYPRMAAEAKEEGFNQVAALFTMVAAIEKEHEERYKALAANIEAGKVYARETEQVWRSAATAVSSISASTRRSVPGLRPSAELLFELKSSNY